MLKLKNFSCGYRGIEVVKNISFDLKHGERLAILGPNGCGKTTLFRGIMGIIPSTGEIKLDGKDLRTMKVQDRSKEMALFTQMNAASFSYTVLETVLLGRHPYISNKLFSRPGAEDYRIAKKQLKRFDMWHDRNKPITELSGGQLQRVMLARTFTQTPRIILLDEPTNHLDLKFQVELVENLKEWTKKDHRAAMGVFHDLNLAISFADKILLMNKGESVFLGETKDLDVLALNRIYGFNVPDYMVSTSKKWEEFKKIEHLQKSV